MELVDFITPDREDPTLCSPKCSYYTSNGCRLFGPLRCAYLLEGGIATSRTLECKLVKPHKPGSAGLMWANETEPK